MKYLLAYSVPLIGILGIYFQGIWSYTLVMYVFVLIPILEHFLPIDASNYSEEELKNRLKNKLYNATIHHANIALLCRPQTTPQLMLLRTTPATMPPSMMLKKMTLQVQQRQRTMYHSTMRSTKMPQTTMRRQHRQLQCLRQRCRQQ